MIGHFFMAFFFYPMRSYFFPTRVLSHYKYEPFVFPTGRRCNISDPSTYEFENEYSHYNETEIQKLLEELIKNTSKWEEMIHLR